MTLSLRAGRPGDAEAMAAIHASVAAPGWSAQDFVTWLKRGDAFAVLVCGDGEPVAFALALGAGDDADVLMVATASQMQRRGAARTALQALAQEAGQRGVRRLVLEVARTNAPALGLYRSEGFVEIGVRPGYYRQAGNLVDAIVLARPVQPAKLG
jgi:ribosomal protein S18 acetylase RimI-like enzyme